MEEMVFENILWLRVTTNDDTQAFSELFSRYYEELYFFALKYAKQKSLAEDAVQQVFCRCWEQRTALSHILNFRSYIQKAIKNEVIDAMRKHLLQLKYFDYLNAMGMEHPVTPEEKMLSSKKEEILSAAMENLSPQQMKVYWLSKQEGWSYQQIAQEMKISIHTVKWHAAAAFQAMRIFLKRHEKELFGLILLFDFAF